MSPFFRRRRTQKKSKKEKINIKKVVHYIPDSGVQYKPESIVHYIPEYSLRGQGKVKLENGQIVVLGEDTE